MDLGAAGIVGGDLVDNNNDIVVVVVKEVYKLVGTTFFDVEHVKPSRFVIDLVSPTNQRKKI